MQNQEIKFKNSSGILAFKSPSKRVAHRCEATPFSAKPLAMFTAIISAPPGFRESISCMTFIFLIFFVFNKLLIF